MSVVDFKARDDFAPTHEQAEAILRQLADTLTPAPTPAHRLPLPGQDQTPRQAPIPEPGGDGKPQILSGDRFHSLLEAVPDGLVLIEPQPRDTDRRVCPGTPIAYYEGPD